MSSIIEKTVHRAAEEFAEGLKYLRPAYGKNGFNERNLSYQFAKEFSRRPRSCAFMEVPYYNAVSGKYNKRIDCLAMDSKLAVFVECKRLYSSEKLSKIALDIVRLNKDITSGVLKGLSVQEKPRDVYMLILAETWQSSVVSWWHGEHSRITWDKNLLPANLVRKSVAVSNSGENELYWLYGYKKII